MAFWTNFNVLDLQIFSTTLGRGALVVSVINVDQLHEVVFRARVLLHGSGQQNNS